MLSKLIKVDRFRRFDDAYKKRIIILDIERTNYLAVIPLECKDVVNVILDALKKAYGAEVEQDLCKCGRMHKSKKLNKCLMCMKENNEL